ncbi:alpha/beta fold hydrolase [Nitrogeniibacter mangrovi]|nr:alpha/beta fold hydrolase [Nitrogeniibacter mangrovi]
MPTGVILLHGKWDTPPFAVAPLARVLTDAGYTVRLTVWPWALRRLYDQALEQVHEGLAAQIAELRRSGCQRVVLCGHSLGGAVALAHAARHGGVDALALLAPGHFPERLADEGLTTEALAQARQAESATARMPLVDVHQGRTRRLRVAPAVYLDYFEPVGPLVWPENTRRLAPEVPMLWVVGHGDPAARLGMDYAFARTPAHRLDRYARIAADHATTPQAGAAHVMDWLRTLDTTS